MFSSYQYYFFLTHQKNVYYSFIDYLYLTRLNNKVICLATPISFFILQIKFLHQHGHL